MIRPSKRQLTMTRIRPDADILTSARMAAGMTSRARRPLSTSSAG
ncbi:MAG TPA: hypothetical protein PLN91_14830 [Rhodanobacteraceae bacterium]|nr:hypothetical protein [Rhodanobacteraceae bacterium]